MSKIIYYVAISLDGFIARKNDSVDWLMQYQEKLDTPYDYETFYKSVDAIIVGRKTMDVAATFEENPYSDRPCYLFTRDPHSAQKYPYAKQVSEITSEWIISVREKHPGNIWLVGGGEIAATFLKLNQIDEVILTLAPVTIGSGIQWVNSFGRDTSWNFKDALPTKSGLVHLVYSR